MPKLQPFFKTLLRDDVTGAGSSSRVIAMMGAGTLCWALVYALTHKLSDAQVNSLTVALVGLIVPVVAKLFTTRGQSNGSGEG